MNRESYFQDKDANVAAYDNVENNTLDNNFSKEKSILFILVVLVVGVIIISYAKDSFLNNYFKSNKISRVAGEGSGYLETYDPIKNANDDTDGDGVSNWREIVSGTNPEDSTSVNADSNKTTLVTSTTSLTKLAAADLLVLSKYKERYPNMNTESLTAGLAANYEKLLLSKRVIDINTADSKDVIYLKGYGNSMAAMFGVIFSNSKFIELTEAQETPATFTKTKIYLSDLKKICEVQKIVQNVPASYAELHKDFIYNCELYVNVLSGMTNLNEDKVRFLISVNKQQEAMKNIFTNFNQYGDRFTNDSVFFKSSEKGYIFINKIN